MAESKEMAMSEGIYKKRLAEVKSRPRKGERCRGLRPSSYASWLDLVTPPLYVFQLSKWWLSESDVINIYVKFHRRKILPPRNSPPSRISFLPFIYTIVN